MVEMDFYGMKRKDLQSLCKKHEIPANSSNFDMATKLTSLLKGVERPSTEGGSCLKRNDDEIGGNDCAVGDMKIKKARLSLEKENVGLEIFVGSRVRSVENADSSDSSRRILEKPARVRRSTVQKPVEDGVVMDSIPPVEKKRVRRTVKDVSKITDKPPLQPPATVELSDKSSGEEPKLSKRRSMRKSPNNSVEATSGKPPLPPAKPPPAVAVFYGSAIAELSDNTSGEATKVLKRRSMRKSPYNRVETTSNKPTITPEKPPLPPAVVGFSSSSANVESKLPKKRLVGKKREGNATKDVNASDNAPPLQPPSIPSSPPVSAPVVEFSGGADKGIGVPRRRVLRKRGVVVEQNEDASEEPPLLPLVPPRTAVQLAENVDVGGPRLPKRKLPKSEVVIESEDVKGLNTSDSFAAEETQLAKRRLLRNRETANSKTSKSPTPSNSVSKVRKPLQQLPPNVGNITPKFIATKKNNGGTEEARISTRRSVRNKENVADFVILMKNIVGSNQVSKKIEAKTEIVQESNVEENVKKQRITLSRRQVTAKAPTVHNEIENKKFLQLEEPLQPKRGNQKKRKCVERKEEPLKGYIRNYRENDVSLHFSKRAGDTESTGDLIDSVSQVGQAKGGIVFWCNGSGCFALPKW